VADPLVVVEDERDWKAEFPRVPTTTAHRYLTDSRYSRRRGQVVINLCRSQAYQSVGYYCSLLAEARGQRVIPAPRTTQDLARGLAWRPRDGLDAAARRWLNAQESARLELDVYFGACEVSAMSGLAREVFDDLHSPLLRLVLRHDGHWGVRSVRARGLHRLRKHERAAFSAALQAYLTRRWRAPRSQQVLRYDLAVLHDPAEPMPPSNPRALKKFIEAGRRHSIDVELIERDDLSRLAEFDALFIRVTTQVNHFTYRFARRAEREGLIVIDDPESILRCTNKVFLAELLQRHRVPVPASLVLNRDNLDEAEARCGYPLVLKVPDGSFSRGVFKAGSRAEFERLAKEMFQHSELLLAQEFTPTDFDWRVGVLGGRALYVSKYFMARKHWQIVKHGKNGRRQSGDAQTLPVEQAPREVVDTAVHAAALIGNGLYGVDLKQTERGVVVIEVNDNPSLDAGVEDEVLKDGLYDAVMSHFVTLLEQR
jgi:glutathione synthase/RimK-type ligase-like ATP-grasp enzyme